METSSINQTIAREAAEEFLNAAKIYLAVGINLINVKDLVQSAFQSAINKATEQLQSRNTNQANDLKRLGDMLGVNLDFNSTRKLFEAVRELKSRAAPDLAKTPSGKQPQEEAICDVCGENLQAVRPGKFQHIGKCKPKTAQPQEWTTTAAKDGDCAIYETESKILIGVGATTKQSERIVAAHNARISAERHHFEKLLAAQVAIEKHVRYCQEHGEDLQNRGCFTEARIYFDLRDELNKLDLSLLHAHDAELWKLLIDGRPRAICAMCGYPELIGSDDCRNCGNNFDPATRIEFGVQRDAEVRKPLVEALQEIAAYMLSPIRERNVKTLIDCRKIAAAALAQVGEEP